MLDCGANECRKLIITFHQVNNSSFLLAFWIQGLLLYDQATHLATASCNTHSRWEGCQEEFDMISTYLHHIIFIFWPRSHYGICIVTILPYVPHHQLIRGLILINSSAYSLPWLLSDGLMAGYDVSDTAMSGSRDPITGNESGKHSFISRKLTSSDF